MVYGHLHSRGKIKTIHIQVNTKYLKKKIDLSTIIFQIDAPNIFVINLIVRLNAYSIFMVKNLESRHEAGVGVTRISYLRVGVMYSNGVSKPNFIHNTFILIFKSISKKL